jgi:CDP-6-deoxy-D-xylo-4-hexulose-3-dehydrase
VSTWGSEELNAIHTVCESGRFTMGTRVEEFEQKFASYFGGGYAVMVNSGSSANLLAVAAMMLERNPKLKRGDEVLVPAISWSTTYFPLHQHGLRLRFVDIDADTLNMDPQRARDAITPRTRAIFAVNLLGAPNDFGRLQELCREHNLCLLEDNCESMGAQWNGRYTGTFGDCGTFSTFFSHHICTMEGGLILTAREDLYHTLKSLRSHGWTRELPEKNFVLNKGNDPFLDLYQFALPGYNVRPLEMSGAVGICQLAKLSDFIAARKRNAAHFMKLFAGVSDIRIQKPPGDSSWFALSITLEGKMKGRRRGLVQRLLDAGVECRPIVAGNFVKNPVIRFFDYSVAGDLKNADHVDENGLYFGNYHIDLASQLVHVAEVIDDYRRAI